MGRGVVVRAAFAANSFSGDGECGVAHGGNKRASAADGASCRDGTIGGGAIVYKRETWASWAEGRNVDEDDGDDEKERQ